MSGNQKREVIRTFKYFAFASSAGVIEIILFSLFKQFTTWSYWPCYLFALIISVIWNFTLNRKFTFKSNNDVSIAMAKVFVYYAIFTPVSTLFGNYLAENMGWNAYLVTILNMLLNGVTEYLYQRLFVFGKSIDTNIREVEEERNLAV